MQLSLTTGQLSEVWEALRFTCQEDGSYYEESLLDALMVPADDIMRYPYWSDERRATFDQDRKEQMAKATAEREAEFNLRMTAIYGTPNWREAKAEKEEFERRLSTQAQRIWKNRSPEDQRSILADKEVAEMWRKSHS